MVDSPWGNWGFVNGKWVLVSNFYFKGLGPRKVPFLGTFWNFFYATYSVGVPKREGKPAQYLAYIFPTMLYPEGGKFDDADTVFVDIYKIDNVRANQTNGFGGVWGNVFGPSGTIDNMGISVYFGPIQDEIIFRIGIRGDDYAGASIIVMEL
jgi:hypothetical protein